LLFWRDARKTEKVAEEIRQFGVRCLPIECDVTKIEMVRKAAELAEKEFGKVDILINNAGSGGIAPAEEQAMKCGAIQLMSISAEFLWLPGNLAKL